MSFPKLRGKIKEVYGTNSSFAEAMGMNIASLSAKLNRKTDWRREEIERSCKLLHIKIEEAWKYFFNQ